MALRKRRVIRADLSAMPLLEQPLAAMHTRADQLKTGDYIYTDMHKGVVYSNVHHNSGPHRIDYYNLDGDAVIAVYEANDIIPVIPWPDRAGNNAILAYQLHVEPVPDTQAPPAPVSSPSGLPMPPISIRAETLRVGDRIRLMPTVTDVFRIIQITNIVGLTGEDCYNLRIMNETTGDIINRFRDRGAMVEVVEQASPQEYFLGMMIKIDGIDGYVTSVSETGSSLRVRIRWVSNYTPGGTATTAEFEAMGVIGNAP